MSDRMSDAQIVSEALEAERLQRDPALARILDDLLAHATAQALRDWDPEARRRGRYMALAVEALREELRNRLDAVENRRRTLERARGFE